MNDKTQIILKGHLDKKWEDWFDGMSIQYDNGNTVITGLITDKSKLHGMLNLIRDLNLDLISLNVEDK